MPRENAENTEKEISMPVYQYNCEDGRLVELVRCVAERDQVPAGLTRICVPIRIGIAGTTCDKLEPGSAVEAVPRAFRKLEEKVPAREIARESGFSVDTIKKVWSM